MMTKEKREKLEKILSGLKEMYGVKETIKKTVKMTPTELKKFKKLKKSQELFNKNQEDLLKNKEKFWDTIRKRITLQNDMQISKDEKSIEILE